MVKRWGGTFAARQSDFKTLLALLVIGGVAAACGGGGKKIAPDGGFYFNQRHGSEVLLSLNTSVAPDAASGSVFVEPVGFVSFIYEDNGGEAFTVREDIRVAIRYDRFINSTSVQSNVVFSAQQSPITTLFKQTTVSIDNETNEDGTPKCPCETYYAAEGTPQSERISITIPNVGVPDEANPGQFLSQTVAVSHDAVTRFSQTGAALKESRFADGYQYIRSAQLGELVSVNGVMRFAPSFPGFSDLLYGQRTSANDIPNSGTISYVGKAGILKSASSSVIPPPAPASYEGTSSITANFGARTVDAHIIVTGTAGGLAFTDVEINNMRIENNGFSGTSGDANGFTINYYQNGAGGSPRLPLDQLTPLANFDASGSTAIGQFFGPLDGDNKAPREIGGAWQTPLENVRGVFVGKQAAQQP